MTWHLNCIFLLTIYLSISQIKFIQERAFMMVRVKTSSVPILLLLSVLVLSIAHGQLLTRRQQFNLLRQQQQQLDGQENVSVRQSAIQVWTLAFNGIRFRIKILCHFLQDNKESAPNRATFERIFDVSFISFQMKHLAMLI